MIYNYQSITVCTCHYHFIVQCGSAQTVPGWGESSREGPGGGRGEEEFSAGRGPLTRTTGHQQNLQISINHDNTVHGENGEEYTYSSVLTVHVVSAGMALSRSRHVRELLLGTRDGVHMDSGYSGPTGGRIHPASSHHDLVLEFNGTSPAEYEDDNNINIYSD